MKPIEFSKKAVRFTDFDRKLYEILEEDILGITYQGKGDNIVYLMNIKDRMRNVKVIRLEKETYYSFLKILDERNKRND